MLVGVDQKDIVPVTGQPSGDIHCQCGFAHATLLVVSWVKRRATKLTEDVVLFGLVPLVGLKHVVVGNAHQSFRCLDDCLLRWLPPNWRAFPRYLSRDRSV